MGAGNLWGWFVGLPPVFHVMAGAAVVLLAWAFWATRKI